MYEAIEKGLEVIKKPNSNNISIKSIDYKLLSGEKYKWIPK